MTRNGLEPIQPGERKKMNENREFPPTDWGLCNRKYTRRMVGGMCLYHGLMAAWGKCHAPGARQNAVCPPIKKYIRDLRRKNG